MVENLKNLFLHDIGPLKLQNSMEVYCIHSFILKNKAFYIFQLNAILFQGKNFDSKSTNKCVWHFKLKHKCVYNLKCLLSCLFIGSSEDQTTPMLVTALKGHKVVDVACGSGDAQTLAVAENGWI